MTIGASELRDYLAGLEYPVSRADLVRWGQENGVSTETLQLLHELPAESFDSPADLTEALGSLA